jgi:NADP-dependent 3-hydroxy acid dehydrogenase YdfG
LAYNATPNKEAIVGEPKVVWITGAASGIGRAVAMRAAGLGWNVVLSGRRAAALDAIVKEIERRGGTAVSTTVDVRDSDSIAAGHSAAIAQWGRLDALVLAAGLNAPRRLWSDQEMPVFDEIVQTNLLGPAHMIAVALPELRVRAGVVVIVSSYSAWAFSPIAGVAYSASKSGLSALTRTLNAQEANAGVRACHICPGDVDSDFLNLRPTVPDAESRKRMLSPDDVARSIQFVLDSPAHVRIDELVVSPVSQR